MIFRLSTFIYKHLTQSFAMKNKPVPFNFAILAAAIGGFAFHAQAAVYSSSFDAAPYTFGASLDGLDGWSVSGVTQVRTPAVAEIGSSFVLPGGTSGISGGQSINFGFQEIDAASAYLSRTVGASLVGNGAGYTEFQAAFAVNDSTPTYSNRDIFQFAFRGSAGENILTIQLQPTSQAANPSLDNRVDQFSWSSDFAIGGSNIGTLNEGTATTLNLTFTPSGVSDVAFSATSAGVPLVSAVLVGAATQNLDNFGFVWIPLDPTNEGANYLNIDDVSLVPEPSSALLACVAGLGLLIRRRR
ncbi:MAG: PEP-CTERM sorting domain-containing protein [Luteolibacter sp.]